MPCAISQGVAPPGPGVGRRNQTTTNRRYELGCRYLRERQARGGDRRSGRSSDQGDHLNDERIADEEHVGPATVRRAAKFAQQVDELGADVGGRLKEAILARRVRASGGSAGSLPARRVRYPWAATWACRR
jgi:hypothetical protein